ncbi:hypothetical protein JR316_0003086 [Psilocybe cubensis]|uniref:Glyoxalase-like domain-containing protein n=2 Tax=Psilocybe cubensis TaxID=181762 RepID=A0A8H7Y4I6_PSICU|nr:hypothetical protein JR316_0003086 [Psilocybe cubensis]KAH9483616.1 hypothetical protein JR316_0003086 [Psilocybe cubensis]
MPINTGTLDHLVHLTPPGTVEEASRQFEDRGFKVLPGGTHVGGLTANALVVLADGVYLELISFTYPASHYPIGSPEREQREKHPWAKKEPGWIDFAFLGNGSHTDSVAQTINERGRAEGSGVKYSPEEDGGRVRPDGQALKWLISAPAVAGRGVLPFFCGDVTPRGLRVPSEPPTNTEHPSTASGIAFVRILISSDSFEAIAGQLTSVVGKKPISSSSRDVIWDLDTVNANHLGSYARLILSVPGDEDEIAFIETSEGGTGIYEVGFYVKDGSKSGSETTPFGKISWVSR